MRVTAMSPGSSRRSRSADTTVIVGAGLAGAKAAEALRRWRYDGRIVLVGAEPEDRYERPPLFGARPRTLPVPGHNGALRPRGSTR